MNTLFTLADWKLAVVRGDTMHGYREWVEAKTEEAAHDRLVTTK